LAIATLVLVLASTLQTRGAVVLLLLPLVLLAWSGFDRWRCRRLYVSAASGRIGLLKTGRTWSRDDVIAARTSGAIELGVTGVVDHALLVPNLMFELTLWTQAGPSSATSRDALMRVVQELDGAALARARGALGASDLVLVRSRSPAAVLTAARAVVRALGVPWIHEGVRGLELRSADDLETSLGTRAPTHHERLPSGATFGVLSRISPDGLQLSWHFTRALAITGVLFLVIALAAMVVVAWLDGELALPVLVVIGGLVWLVFWLLAQHGTYALQVRSDELILSGVRSYKLPLADLLDVEARLSDRPALCLVTRTMLIELPTSTPAKALYLAHALAAALHREPPAP
jgi:hypothetical protein